MDADALYAKIKEYCTQSETSIAQVEKELNFGTGTIGKWKQSFPSIEKVVAVAEYFHASIDELCGLEERQAVSKLGFMEALIKKTLEGEIDWYPCSYQMVADVKFCPPFQYSDVIELYRADYNDGSLYIKYKEDDLEFYIYFEGCNCMKQEENINQLRELWNILKDKEQKMQEKINQYKRMMTK